jgi:hypothetical protein
MTLATFLQNVGINDFNQDFIDVMDSVGEPIIRIAYGLPAPAPAGIATTITPIISAVPAALGAKNSLGSDVAAGATILLAAFAADVDTQICLRLTTGANSLLIIPPGLGSPGGPVIPSTLLSTPANQRPEFCRALMLWAISLLPNGDLRLVTPLTA